MLVRGFARCILNKQGTAILQHLFPALQGLRGIGHNHVKLTGVDDKISRNSSKSQGARQRKFFSPCPQGIIADGDGKAEFPQNVSHKFHAADTATQVGSAASQDEHHLIFPFAFTRHYFHGHKMEPEAGMQAAELARNKEIIFFRKKR